LKRFKVWAEKRGIHKFMKFYSLGETFPGLKEKEEKQYGEYRPRRLVLEAWDNL